MSGGRSATEPRTSATTTRGVPQGARRSPGPLSGLAAVPGPWTIRERVQGSRNGWASRPIAERSGPGLAETPPGGHGDPRSRSKLSLPRFSGMVNPTVPAIRVGPRNWRVRRLLATRFAGMISRVPKGCPPARRRGCGGSGRVVRFHRRPRQLPARMTLPAGFVLMGFALRRPRERKIDLRR